MRTSAVLGLAVLLAFAAHPISRAAPAPDGGDGKKELEALKKRLPALVDAWAKERLPPPAAGVEMRLLPAPAGGGRPVAERVPPPAIRVEVKYVRRFSRDEAKVCLLARSVGPGRPGGGRDTDGDTILTIYLRYYDGAWTTTHHDGFGEVYPFTRRAALFLMTAIDETTGK